MWTRNQLLEFFAPSKERPAYLDFFPKDEIRQSGAIRSREVATVRSLQESDLREVAALEGSPSFETIVSMLDSISELNSLPKLSGIGVELGSGIGLLSAAILSADDEEVISGILALEAGLPFIQEGIERTSRAVLGENFVKIMPCYGSFDKIEVESESIDFILQIEALHHADSLNPPLREAFRILKKEGYLISIDRSWPNGVKDSTLKELLDHEYEKEWLIKKGFPSEKPFTRRDNGEHEYRDFEWKNSFEEAGFEIVSMDFIHPKIEKFHLMKRFVTLLRLTRILRVKIPSRGGLLRAFLHQHLFVKIPGRLSVTAHPRPLTVFVLKK